MMIEPVVALYFQVEALSKKVDRIVTSRQQNIPCYNAYHPIEVGYQNLLWNNGEQHWEVPQEECQKGEILGEDALQLQRVLANFIEASDVCIQNMETTRRCHEASYKNLEHQLGGILDTLSKEQQAFEQAIQVPYRDDVVVNDN